METVAPKPSLTIDQLTARHTAFQTMQDMLFAAGNYFPSIPTKSTRGTRRTELTRIANTYDAYQAVLGDSRRACRS